MMKAALCAALSFLLLVGCTALRVEPVQPWQRGYLSLPAMSFDSDPLDSMLREKTFASKETARGGAAIGGGGCGCN